MSNLPRLSQEQFAAVEQRVNHCLGVAERELRQRFPTPQLRFDLRGAAAGQFRGGDEFCVLRFNSQLFALYFDDNLEQTVPHEVAHYLVYQLFTRRDKRSRVRPHGREWQALMALLGAPAEVRHTYDISQIPVRRERRVLYLCGCREHRITLRTHRKMVQGQQRACTRCKQKLQLKV